MATHQARQLAERILVSATVRTLLDADYLIDVNDGEEDVLDGSDDHDQILKVMFSTDEDVIFAVKDGKRRGWVRFVYGNSGFDVMSDCTSNLEPVLAPAINLANTLEGDPLAVLDWAANHSGIAKDAARYRWLRDKHNEPSSQTAVMGSLNDEEVMLEDVAGLPAEKPNGAPGLDLDAAIDALMAKESSCAAQ
jgi:hypothetical protein